VICLGIPKLTGGSIAGIVGNRTKLRRVCEITLTGGALWGKEQVVIITLTPGRTTN